MLCSALAWQEHDFENVPERPEQEDHTKAKVKEEEMEVKEEKEEKEEAVDKGKEKEKEEKKVKGWPKIEIDLVDNGPNVKRAPSPPFLSHLPSPSPSNPSFLRSPFFSSLSFHPPSFPPLLFSLLVIHLYRL